MKRVGFTEVDVRAKWLGGVNYYRSLFSVLSRGDSRYRPVLILPPGDRDQARALFGDIDVITSALVPPRSVPGRARRLVERKLGRDLIMEVFLRARGIFILSHSRPLGPRGRLPNLSWIPDFQHLRLPHLFSAKELAYRDQEIGKIINGASGLIVSSETAKADFAAFYPRARVNVHVLAFSPRVEAFDPLPVAELTRLYNIGKKYIYLPNQFWAHKNHRVVVRALGLLKEGAGDIEIVCTGSSEDYRNPDYFGGLMKLVAEEGVAARFRILGVVPYPHVQSLMHHAHAVINPSLFEGWSTTVEEAKFLGKRLLLSDIPVHREQAGDRAVFFGPDDKEACASRLRACWTSESPVCAGFSAKDAEASSERFGREFTRILDLYAGRKRVPGAVVDRSE